MGHPHLLEPVVRKNANFAHLWMSGVVRPPATTDFPVIPKFTRVPTPTKEPLTVSLPAPLIDRLRDAVFWTRGLTLASLVKEALTQCLDEMERQNGKAFPRRRDKLKGGRPRLFPL